MTLNFASVGIGQKQASAPSSLAAVVVAGSTGFRSLTSPAVSADGLSSLLLQATGPSGSKMQLLETEFSRSVPELIELHLLQQDSIPAFLSALTIELFSRQTSI